MNATVPPEKLQVALELDKSLVEAAERLGPSLSATVETLLAAHVKREQARAEAAAYAAFSTAFIEKYGDWGEEFRTL